MVVTWWIVFFFIVLVQEKGALVRNGSQCCKYFAVHDTINCQLSALEVYVLQ